MKTFAILIGVVFGILIVTAVVVGAFTIRSKPHPAQHSDDSN